VKGKGDTGVRDERVRAERKSEQDWERREKRREKKEGHDISCPYRRKKYGLAQGAVSGGCVGRKVWPRKRNFIGDRFEFGGRIIPSRVDIS